MRTNENLDFIHFERFLGGVDTDIELDGHASARIARALVDAHLGVHMDVSGAFGYIGWPGANRKPKTYVPTSAEQLEIYGAFERATVATRVFIGAMEPNEGFGLAWWKKDDTEFSGEYLEGRNRLLDTVALAVALIKRPSLLAATSAAIGCGRLRGAARRIDALRKGRSLRHRLVALPGPEVVETFYGEIPNRCGAIAKGKGGIDRAHPLRTGRGALIASLFHQPWTLVYGQEKLDRDKQQDHRMRQRPSDAGLVERVTLPQPGTIQSGHKKPFLIGLSLDFAQSRDAYRENAYRARALVDEILNDFNQLPAALDIIFISPRYGDGVAAVITVEETSESKVRQGRWYKQLKGFVGRATKRLRPWGSLGLRIGVAIGIDERGCAARLAGLGQTSCTSVESIASEIIGRSRECHAPAKERGKTDRAFAAKGCARMFELLPNKTVRVLG